MHQGWNRMKRRSNIAIVVMATSFLTGCASIFGPISGEVVDKETGLPIENVVVIRSWDHGSAGPGGAVHKRAKHVEMTTKRNGHYFFGPDIFFSPIPIFTWTEANPILFYKPGYEVYESEKIPSVVSLSALPINKSVRKKELRKAEGHRFLYESNILKQVVTEEGKSVNSLPEYTAGVLYKLDENYGNNVAGVAIDSNDSVYISTQGYVNKLVKTNNGYLTNNVEIDDDYFPNYSIQIASDTEGKIYFLQNGYLKIQGSLSTFKTEANPERLNDLGDFKVINSHYQPKNKGQLGFPTVDTRFAVDQNGNLQFGTTTYSINGHKVGSIAAIPDNSIIRYPETVDTAFDKDHVLYIAYNDKYNQQNNAIATISNGGKNINFKYKLINNRITGIAIAFDKIYISDNAGFHVFNKSFEPIESKILPINIFGKVLINGIKLDNNHHNLLLIDIGYARVLSYNLEKNQWHSPDSERISKELKYEEYSKNRRLIQINRESRKNIPLRGTPPTMTEGRF